MSKMDKIYQWVGEQAKTAAESWFKQQCANPYASLYLYYKQGELVVSEDCPNGFELADGKRIGPAGTIEQITREIDRKARMLPILPQALCV